MNWLDITLLLCLAGIEVCRKACLMESHQTGCFAYGPSDLRSFFCGKAGGSWKDISWRWVGFRKKGGYDLELYSGFILIMGYLSSGWTGYQGGRGGTPLSVINHLFWWFSGLLVVWSLPVCCWSSAGVRGSWIGLDSSPIKDRISFYWREANSTNNFPT